MGKGLSAERKITHQKQHVVNFLLMEDRRKLLENCNEKQHWEICWVINKNGINLSEKDNQKGQQVHMTMHHELLCTSI